MQASHFGFRIGEVPGADPLLRRRVLGRALGRDGLRREDARRRRAPAPAPDATASVAEVHALTAARGAGRITGERVMTPEGGFNPTWQRHVAAYRVCALLLPPGRLLDLGCGVGHSYELLAPRETVGVDLDPEALAGQDRETRVADMRALPFADGAFASVLSVQSIEHVPDPGRALAEVVRVLEPGGTAASSPRTLTFARADEIVDPSTNVQLGRVSRRSPWLADAAPAHGGRAADPWRSLGPRSAGGERPAGRPWLFSAAAVALRRPAALVALGPDLLARRVGLHPRPSRLRRRHLPRSLRRAAAGAPDRASTSC